MLFARAGALLLAVVCLPSVVLADDPKTMTLADAYRLALKTSERIALARAGVADADIHARETWNQVTPTIDASAQLIAQREITLGMGDVFQPGRQFVAGARLQQPVFRRGFFAGRDASEHRRAGASAELVREREELVRDVAEAYIAVIRTRAVRDLARAAVDRTVALKDHTAGRVKAGSALRTAELLAQLDVQRAQRQLATAQRDVGVAQATFTRVIGREPPDLVAPPVPAIPERAKARDQATRRADVQALQRRVSETAARVESTAGQRWWPTLDLEASVQYYSPDVLNNAVDWRVIGTLTIPILRNGSEYTNLALRRNEARVAELQLAAQQRQVIDEVDIAAVELATSEETAKLAETQLKTAREHYGLVEKQFKLGAITFLEVTNAETVLSEAENAYELARADRIRAAYQYAFAVGGSALTAVSE